LFSSRNVTHIPPELAGNVELMQYAVKGSDAQWDEALKHKDVSGNIVQIKSRKEKISKRKLDQEDIEKEMPGVGKSKKSKKKGGKKKRT
jgi:hypothetical protein